METNLQITHQTPNYMNPMCLFSPIPVNPSGFYRSILWPIISPTHNSPKRGNWSTQRKLVWLQGECVISTQTTPEVRTEHELLELQSSTLSLTQLFMQVLYLPSTVCSLLLPTYQWPQNLQHSFESIQVNLWLFRKALYLNSLIKNRQSKSVELLWKPPKYETFHSPGTTPKSIAPMETTYH